MSKRESIKLSPDFEFLAVGYIRGHWGTGGHLKVEVQTDFPDRFDPGKTVYLAGTPLTIQSSRHYRDLLLIKLESVDAVEEARQLHGKTLDVPLDEANPLPEGEYYRFQLMGLEVICTTGKPVGRIVNILPTGSNDVYIVQGQTQKEMLIPAINDVIKSIDLETNQMVIEVIDGLLD